MLQLSNIESTKEEELLMTKLISVVGKAGSGKSTFCKLLSKLLGCKTIDVDEIGHSIYDDQEFADFIAENLGCEYVDERGKVVDRKMIGDYIFSTRNKKIVEKFNSVSWKLMEAKIDKMLESINDDYALIEWYNLPKTKYFAQCDSKILVKPVDEEQRIMMVRLTDNISNEYLEKREKASVDFDEKDFDIVFKNDYVDQKTIDCVQKIAQSLLDDVSMPQSAIEK